MLKFSYTWKRGDFTGDIGQKWNRKKKFHCFLSTAVRKCGWNCKAFVAFFEHFADRNEKLKIKGKLNTFFEIGLELVEKIEW